MIVRQKKKIYTCKHEKIPQRINSLDYVKKNIHIAKNKIKLKTFKSKDYYKLEKIIIIHISVNEILL